MPLDRAGVEVGETGVGPAPELQPLRAGQSRAEADTGRAAFLSEGHGGPLFSSLLSPAGLGLHRVGCQQYRGQEEKPGPWRRSAKEPPHGGAH